MHFGTHGALEFMPGKQIGLSGECWPDRLIDELPNFYIYSVNNPSEGSIAKLHWSESNQRLGKLALEVLGPESQLDGGDGFWNGFWQKSFVQYSNQDGAADYLENLYYLSTYMIAVGAYGAYFTTNDGGRNWSSAKWRMVSNRR